MRVGGLSFRGSPFNQIKTVRGNLMFGTSEKTWSTTKLQLCRVHVTENFSMPFSSTTNRLNFKLIAMWRTERLTFLRTCTSNRTIFILQFCNLTQSHFRSAIQQNFEFGTNLVCYKVEKTIYGVNVITGA